MSLKFDGGKSKLPYFLPNNAGLSAEFQPFSLEFPGGRIPSVEPAPAAKKPGRNASIILAK